jgi:hypothetical protein
MAASGGGGGLPGAIEAVVGAAPGMNSGAEDGGEHMVYDGGDTHTPLGDALPFEYAPDMPANDTEELAARGVGMTGNEPGGYRINPNGLDVDYFDSNGSLCAQYHESHGEVHGHNFVDGKRDNVHIPMSPINCR